MIDNKNETTKAPKWKSEGYFKKGQLVKRRRNRHQSEDKVYKKYGLGIVIEEVKHLGEWTHVLVHWQGINARKVELKKNVRRASWTVESVVIPRSSLTINE